MPRWLVLGSRGALGRGFCEALDARGEVAGACDLPELDITRTSDVEAEIAKLTVK
jgi:dTDP-4-dehydrorhamnose reductase